MKWFIPLFVFALFCMPALAADFNVSVRQPEYFYASRTGMINISITNYAAEDWFDVSVVGSPSGWIRVDPWALKIAGTGDSKIYVTPSEDAREGTYSYDLSVSASDGTKFKKQLFITVRQIISAKISDFNVDCYDCTDKINVFMTLENSGTQIFDGWINLQVGTINRSVPLERLGLTETRVMKETLLLAGLQPGKYKMNIQVYNSAGALTETKSVDFSILASKNIVYNKTSEPNIFGNFVSIVATNKGNTEEVAQITSEMGGDIWHIYSGPSPSAISKNTYTWSMKLQPGESTQVNYAEIFWPLPTIIIALLLYFISLFLFVPFKLQKNILSASPALAGRELAISLSLLAKRNVNNVILRDVVPHGFSVVGKLGDALTRKMLQGTELVWKIGDMATNEERIFNYKIKVLSDIIGSTELPKANVHAKIGDRIKNISSNRVELQGTKVSGVQKMRVRVEK